MAFQNKVSVFDYSVPVGAAATANVSVGSGTITSIVISDGGVGYTTTPDVTIGNPVGLGTHKEQPQLHPSLLVELV